MKKKIWPYEAVILLNFYVLPFFIKDTGSAMIVLLTVIPFICFITAVFYGLKNGFQPFFPLLVILTFIPSIFIYYNISAWVYIFLFGFISLIGNALALLISKKKT